MTQRLRLIAQDSDDLKVVSATLQDSIGRVGEIIFDKRGRALTLRLTRFSHEQENPQRILAGLRIDSVLDIKTRGIDRANPEAMAVLLSIDFVEGKLAPGGVLNLVFAGDGQIRVDVECIDITLADVSDPRNTDKTPLHPVESV